MSRRFGGGGGDRERERRERSAEERVRARQEREARRAAREGRSPREMPPLPDAPTTPVTSGPLVQPPVPIEAPHAVIPPAAEDPPAAFAPESEPAPESAPAPESEPAPESAPAPESEPAPESAPAPESEPAPYASESFTYDPAPAPAPANPPSAHEPPPVDDSWAPDEPRRDEPPIAPEPEDYYAPALPAAFELSAPAPELELELEPERTPSPPEPPIVEGSWALGEPKDLGAPASVVVQGRADAPAGVKRVSASALASAAGAEAPPRFGAPPRGVPKGRRGARRLIPLLILVLAAAVALFLFRLFEPGADAGEGRVSVTIPPGTSAEQIGRLLVDKEVVDSRFFFSLRARLSGDNLRAGTLRLRRSMSYEAALAALTRAPPPAPVMAKVTLPEGPSRRELAALVKTAFLKGSYVSASRRSGVLDPGDYGAPQDASLEGFLFPATYELKPGSSAKALVSQQLRVFKRRFSAVDMATARRRKLTRFDVLTIASMIEREASVAKDRRLISGVIYNRLKQGMPLGIDATIRYDLENFSAPLKDSELKRDTPYNTRTRTGLPPGPIGNPGLASIQAAANPATNDFVYYVIKPCANGAHAFSSTDAQFQRDKAAYETKREELGGKAPSRC